MACCAGRRLAQRLMRVLVEQVAGLERLLLEKAQIERAGVGDAERLGQAEMLGLLGAGEEDGDAVHQQRAREAVDHRAEHLVEIGFGAQVAAELDQGAPVVVTLAIEHAVEALLDPVLHGLEQERGHDHGHHQAGGPGAGHARVHDLRRHADRAEVETQNGRRRQRVGHAALEDDVHVHQPVADDGVAEGQGQEHQREGRDRHQPAGQSAGQERDDVEQGERGDRQDGAARHPLQLLAQDGSMRPPVGVPEHHRSHREQRGQIEHLHPIQVPAQQLGGGARPQHPDVESPAAAARAGRPAALPSDACGRTPWAPGRSGRSAGTAPAAAARPPRSPSR